MSQGAVYTGFSHSPLAHIIFEFCTCGDAAVFSVCWGVCGSSHSCSIVPHCVGNMQTWASLNVARVCSLLQITVLSALSSVLGTDTSRYQYSAGGYTTNSTCPTDGTAGGILGESIGQLTATANMDSSFYGWVGCNCSSLSQERVYEIATSGDVHTFCS